MLSDLFCVLKLKKKKDLIFLFSLMFISTLLEILSLGSLIPVLNAFSKIEQTEFFEYYISLFGIDNKKEHIFLIVIFLFLTVYTIKILINSFLLYFENRFIYSFKEVLNEKLFKIYSYQNISFFLKKNSSEIIRNLTSEIDQITIFILHFLRIILDLLTLIAIVIFLLFFNPFFTSLIIIIFFLISVLYLNILKKKIHFWSKLRLVNLQKKIQFIKEGFLAIKEIKLLGREDYFLDKFKKINSELSVSSMKYNLSNLLPKNFFELIGILTIGTILSFYNHEAIDRGEILKNIGIFLFALFKVIPSFKNLINGIQTLNYNKKSLNIISKDLKIFEPKIKFLEDTISFDKKIELNIKNFYYKNTTSKFSLKNIKISIKKNERVGLIGDSGSGKSTVLDLLTGIHENKLSHTLKIDDVYINRKNSRSWQKRIGYVPQKIFLLEDSVKNNVLFGLNPLIYKNQDIIKLLEKLNLKNFLKNISYNLNTIISENGFNVSGGEIQRIGIARALIYNPEFIILDEATSGLDSETESKIFEEVLTINKTFLIVTHNKNLIKYCQKVIDLNKK
jgi:ABC-type multidrug transport system fused ATPase/permease subunit